MLTSCRWTAAILCALTAVAVEAHATTIPIDSLRTFLRTSSDPGALPTIPLALSSLGLSPGDKIKLTRLGDWDCGSPCGDDVTSLIAVFSSSDVLLASDLLDRVPGAIDAGVDVDTGVTFFGSLPTNIAEDFAILGTGVTVRIPVGAAYLFIAAGDSLYGDNFDPDGDFAVDIAPVATPEPSAIFLLSVGLLGVAAFRSARP